MADQNIPENPESSGTTEQKSFTFTAYDTRLYSLSPNASKSDIYNHLDMRLSQLGAMLMVIHGAGFESFSQWNDSIQDTYLSACSMMAEECAELADRL
jgi:hypothetical protein